MTYWYRYRDEYFREGDVRIFEQVLKVLKETPKGVWLNDSGNRRFVLRDARKRFACPTRQEALESFIARKRLQRSFALGTAERAEIAIGEAESMLIKERAA